MQLAAGELRWHTLVADVQLLLTILLRVGTPVGLLIHGQLALGQVVVLANRPDTNVLGTCRGQLPIIH